jgi:hypothetical protein
MDEINHFGCSTVPKECRYFPTTLMNRSKSGAR